MGVTSPKPKKRRELYSASNWTPREPIRRVKRSYSRRRKQKVLLFLVHHRIFILMNGIDSYDKQTRVLENMPEVLEEGYRRPNTAEAQNYFLIGDDFIIRR
jgi:hypothetical protein